MGGTNTSNTLTQYDVTGQEYANGSHVGNTNSYVAQQHFADGREIKLRSARGTQSEPDTSYADHYPPKVNPSQQHVPSTSKAKHAITVDNSPCTSAALALAKLCNSVLPTILSIAMAWGNLMSCCWLVRLAEVCTANTTQSGKLNAAAGATCAHASACSCCHWGTLHSFNRIRQPVRTKVAWL